MIKIIHQTWKSKKNIPNIFKQEWLDSWRLKNPSWEVKWWDDEDCRNLIKNHYPAFLFLYDGYEKNIHRADVFRYFMLHKYGGVYADMDCECIEPLEKIIKEQDRIILGKEMTLGHGLDPATSNAFMYSVPGHPFWEYVCESLEFYDLITEKEEVLAKTGPLMLTDKYLQYKDKEEIRLLGLDIFVWVLADIEVNVENGYILHHTMNTWKKEILLEEKNPDLLYLSIL